MATRDELYRAAGVPVGTNGAFGSDEQFWKALTIDTFLSFGYEPTIEEIMALAPASAGTGGGVRGPTAVADYVRTQKMEAARQADDPLKKFIEEQKPKIGELETQAKNLYEELRGVISKAPRLFGALDESQIDQLLAPLQRATAESSARLAGQFGRRGLAGSTIESEQLAAQERIFRENAMRAGLGIGLQQQEAERMAIQNYLNQIFGRQQQLTGLVAGGAGQLSGQDLAQLQFLAGLPLLERGVAANERAAAEAQARRRSGLAPLIGQIAGTLFGGERLGGIGAAAGSIYEGNYPAAQASFASATSGFPGIFGLGGQGSGGGSLTPLGSTNNFVV